MRILKFGGKSLATPEKVQNACKIIQKIYKKDKKIVVVVSANGSETDELIKQAKSFCGENLEPRELDVLLSTGETKSSALFSMALCNLKIPSKSFQAYQLQITTFGAFQNSKIAHIDTKPLLECFEKNIVAIVSGFQGVNKNGEITTLGRGGSDTTAAAISATLGQDVEIFSDFDGVFCGDPRELDFKKIKTLDYNSMILMAESGAKVLDARAAKIAKSHNFNIHCKSSSQPNKKGTLISNIESDFVSISTKKDLCEFCLTFSNKQQSQIIMKNVLKLINNIEFYNLTLKNNQINFLTKQENHDMLLMLISKKLNIAK